MFRHRHICATTAFLLLFMIESNAASAASHIVKIKPASPGGPIQIASCKDNADCHMTITVIPPATLSSFTANIAFRSDDVRIRFSFDGADLYASQSGFGRENKVIHAALDEAGNFKGVVQLFELSEAPQRTWGDSLVIRTRPDYVARVEITIAPETRSD